MKAPWFLLILAFTTPTLATEPSHWQFVFVSRTTDLWVRSGQGTMTIDGGRLTGKFVGDQDTEFYLTGTVKKGKVSVHFGAVESDDGGSIFSGELRQSFDGGSKSCWQTMQLTDGFSSLSLARNAPLCEP